MSNSRQFILIKRFEQLTDKDFFNNITETIFVVGYVQNDLTTNFDFLDLVLTNTF